MEDAAIEQESNHEDSASDKEGNECAAAESDDDIMDETILQSPVKNRTRSKSRKVGVHEALMCSDSEDELPCQQPSKRHRASPAPLWVGGHSKYFKCNSY